MAKNTIIIRMDRQRGIDLPCNEFHVMDYFIHRIRQSNSCAANSQPLNLDLSDIAATPIYFQKRLLLHPLNRH